MYRLLKQAPSLAKNRISKNDAINYKNLFKDNHSIMLIVDPETTQIIDANMAACSFYGYSIDELKKLKSSDINILPQIDIKKIYSKITAKNKQLHLKHKLKNGVIKDVEVSAGKLEIRDQTYIYAIINDISNRVHYMDKLIEARKRAEESDRLKSAFLANMSHEIRTPMNSILGFSSLLTEDDPDTITRREYLNYIQINGEHLLELINDIIDLSKIEANQLSIKLKDCSLNELLDDIHVVLKNQLTEYQKDQIELILHKGIKKQDFTIKTDEIRLRQIILNLLSNAIKFTEKGSIEFGYKFREDSIIQFFVKDTGIGIPEDKQHVIFSVFEQIENDATRNYGGTGLGLSISKSLVNKLGGHIWVESDLEEGSRFYFTISAMTNQLNLN